MLFALVVAGLLVVHNSLLNIRPRPRGLYLSVNLALAAALLALARVRGLSPRELGLDPRRLTAGLGWGMASAVVVAGTLALARWLAPHVAPVRRLLSDRRAAGLDRGGLLFETLLRIPLGTALPEEVAFRGLLLAAFARVNSTSVAVLASSAVFGLWHVAPTLQALRINEAAPTRRARLLTVTGAVVVTAVGGVIFCLLRLASGSLLASTLAHWAGNAFALIAARMQPGGQRPTAS